MPWNRCAFVREDSLYAAAPSRFTLKFWRLLYLSSPTSGSIQETTTVTRSGANRHVSNKLEKGEDLHCVRLCFCVLFFFFVRCFSFNPLFFCNVVISCHGLCDDDDGTVNRLG